MAQLQAPNYLQGHAAPGALRPTYPSPTMATTTFQGQPNYQTREGRQNWVPPVAPQKPTAAPKLTIPPAQNLISPTQMNDWWQKIYLGDPLWGPQTSQLGSQVGNLWTAGALQPFEQGFIDYGGTFNPEQMATLNQLKSPEWFNPLTKTNEPVGYSFADALAGRAGLEGKGPDIMSAAAKNPFSAVAQIAHQLGLANAASNLNIAQSGAMSSGSVERQFQENNWQADALRAEAAKSFLGQTSQNYTGFLKELMGATQTEQSYTSAMLERIAALVAAGKIVPPTTAAEGGFLGGPGPFTTTTGSYNPGYTTSGYGPYAKKPLY